MRMYNTIIEILEQLLDSTSMSCNKLTDSSVKWDIDGIGTVILKIEDIKVEE